MSDPAVDFEAAKPHISAALAYSGEPPTHTLDDIREGIEAGRYNLWRGPNSAIVTELVVNGRQHTVHFFLAGGRLDELETMTPHILDWAKGAGCTHATFVGRRGWERTFITRTGWRYTLAVFEKSLSDGQEQ